MISMCFSEPTQPTTMLCKSAAAWEGTDTRNSFCFCTGENEPFHQTCAFFMQSVQQNPIPPLLEETMLWI